MTALVVGGTIGSGIFGDLGGFFANYGHDVGDAMGDTSYLVVIFSALGAFGVFGEAPLGGPCSSPRSCYGC